MPGEGECVEGVHVEAMIADATDRILALLRCTPRASAAMWERMEQELQEWRVNAHGRAASLADTINQELRENGPLGVYQVDTNDDMREAVRLLVDYVRESATHAARAEMAQEIRAVSDGQLTYCGGEGETPCKRGSCWGCDVARILDAAIRAQEEPQ